jgi:hypothetical protein
MVSPLPKDTLLCRVEQSEDVELSAEFYPVQKITVFISEQRTK